MALEGFAHGGTIQVPQPHRVVTTTTDNRLSIGAKGNRSNWLGMALEGPANGSAIQAPQPHRVVTTTTDYRLAIGAKGDQIDAI